MANTKRTRRVKPRPAAEPCASDAQETTRRGVKSKSKSSSRTIAAKSVQTWKPHKNTTKKYLTGIIETTSSYILSRSSSEVFEDIQSHLDMIKKKLYRKIETAHVPGNNLGDYQKMNLKTNALKESVQQLEQQQASLEAAILQRRRRCDELVSQIHRLQNHSGSIHPAFLPDASKSSS